MSPSPQPQPQPMPVSGRWRARVRPGGARQAPPARRASTTGQETAAGPEAAPGPATTARVATAAGRGSRGGLPAGPRGSRAPGPSGAADGRGEVRLRPAAYLGADALHRAHLPAAGLQPDPAVHGLALVPAVRAVHGPGDADLPRLAARGRLRRGVRPGRAPQDRAGVAAGSVPAGRRVPAHLRRAGRAAPQQLDPRRRAARRLPGQADAVRARRRRQARAQGAGQAVRFRATRPGRTGAGT